jgi:CHAD domain-containing protein
VTAEVIYALPTKAAAGRVLGRLQRELRTKEEGRGGVRSYLDTFDRLLLARGTVLSHGPDAEPGALRWDWLDGSLLRRVAMRRPPAFAEDLPEGPFRDALADVIGVRRLLPLARVRDEGARLRVLNRDRKTVGRIGAEAWSPPGRRPPGRPPGLWLRVSAVKGYEKRFAEVRRLLEEGEGLEPAAPDPVRGLLGVTAPWVEGPPEKGPVPLEPVLRTDEAFRRLLLREIGVMRRNEEGTKAALDAEFLHDFRVAVRRTRAALAAAKGVFPAARLARFKREFKWLGTVTGPRRDMDVHVARCPTYEASLPEASGERLKPLRAHLERRQEAVQKPLVRALDSKRYQRLLADWEAFLESPPPERTSLPRAARPVGEVARRLIARTHRRLVEHGLAIREHTPAEALHEVRLDGKKLRYLLDFFRSLYPAKEIRTHVRALKRLQDNLGDFNDLEVQQGALEEAAQQLVARDEAPHETLVALGRLVQSLAERQQRERERFAACFAEFHAPENIERAVRLFGPQAEPKP